MFSTNMPNKWALLGKMPLQEVKCSTCVSSNSNIHLNRACVRKSRTKLILSITGTCLVGTGSRVLEEFMVHHLKIKNKTGVCKSCHITHCTLGLASYDETTLLQNVSKYFAFSYIKSELILFTRRVLTKCWAYG